MKHRNIIRKTAALLLAAVMSCSVNAGVLAFTDPAEEYQKYRDGDVSFTETTETVSETTVTTETEYDDVDEFPADEEEKVGIEIYEYKTNLAVGESFKLKYRFTPAGTKEKVKYSTSKKAVATIAADGTVTAKKTGTATISVTSASGAKASFKLTVSKNGSRNDSTSDKPISSSNDSGSSTGSSSAKEIELSRTSVTLIEGETYQIKYSLYPQNCTDSVSFRSLMKSVATVDSNGLVTAKGAGNTRIVCTTGSGISTKLSITVVSFPTAEEQDKMEEESAVEEYNELGQLVASKVVLDDESLMVRVGEKVGITGRVYPKGCVFTVSYSSSDSSVAKVSQSGRITGVSEGSCIITVTTDNGKTDDLYVTVYGDMIPGIDVSKWNGDVNWKAVKDSGKASFVMIRASYGQEDTDPMLEQNVRGCEEYGIPYGFYHYTYAKSVSEAKTEARYFLAAIRGYSPEYPVVLDIEEDFYKSMSRRQVTDIAVAFMEELENAGYYAMIYSFAKFFDDCLYFDEITDYDIWVACWGDMEKLNENYRYHYGMWQYSETGTIAGIDEDVDLNYCYKDYRTIIRKYGLNRS